MTDIPQWLLGALRCPTTGVALTQEDVDGRTVYVARPTGIAPLYYEIDNGVPVLLPQK